MTLLQYNNPTRLMKIFPHATINALSHEIVYGYGLSEINGWLRKCRQSIVT
jgi:hypothetical protein